MTTPKKRKKKQIPVPEKKDKRVLIATSRNVEVECLPIAAALDALETNIRNSIEWPEKPTRTIRDVAGSEMEQDLTQEYVESDRATDEEKIAWTEYLEAQGEAQAEFNQRAGTARVRLVAWEGIRVTDESLFDKWAEDEAWMGMTAPDDPRERALHYLQSKILGNPNDDLLSIMVGIYHASGYDEEALKQAEAFFRSQVGQRERAAPDDGTGDSGVPEQEETSGLVGQSGIRDGEGEEGAGSDAR